MWKREDYLGNIVTWYSEKEHEEILAKYKEILYNIYRAIDTCTPIENIEDYIEDESIMKELYRRRDEEWKKSTNVKNVERSTDTQ